MIRIFLVLTAVGLIGALSYEDEQHQEQVYNEMVCEGTWPDFKELKPQCK